MTQSAIYGEQWSHIRDHQNRGTSERDARELFHITQVEFQPPSKAHIKRIQRKRIAVVTRQRRPEPAPDPVRLRENAITRDAIAIVRILRPDFKRPIVEPNPPKPPVLHVERPQPGDAERRERLRRENLRRDHLIALGRAKSKPLLSAKHSLEIHELWNGDFTAYLKEIAK